MNLKDRLVFDSCVNTKNEQRKRRQRALEEEEEEEKVSLFTKICIDYSVHMICLIANIFSLCTILLSAFSSDVCLKKKTDIYYERSQMHDVSYPMHSPLVEFRYRCAINYHHQSS